MEILDIVDDNGIPTGKTVERKTAHRERHPAPHGASLDCAQKVWKYRTSPAETMHGEGFLSGLL